jgi:hypothetical protein
LRAISASHSLHQRQYEKFAVFSALMVFDAATGAKFVPRAVAEAGYLEARSKILSTDQGDTNS